MTAAKQLSIWDAPVEIAVKAVPSPTNTPADRDAAIDRHDKRHTAAIAAATRAAMAIYTRNGRVTAPEIPAEMRANGDGWMLSGETRWMGAVLIPSKGWVKTDLRERTGSRGRDVPVWVRS